MSTVIQNDTVIVYGAASEMTTPSGKPVGSLFIVDSGAGLGDEYSVGVDTNWFPRNKSRERTEIYDDGSYTYICKAVYGSALNAAAWLVRRVDNATGSSTSSATGQLATDVATVTALTYNNGV